MEDVIRILEREYKKLKDERVKIKRIKRRNEAVPDFLTKLHESDKKKMANIRKAIKSLKSKAHIKLKPKKK